MNRREAIIRLATLMGASVVGPRLFAADLDPAAAASRHGFSSDELALLDEIGETILPETDIPGAKAVQIGAFIAMMIGDCYEPRDQAEFRRGLVELPRAFAGRFGGTFVTGSAADRTALLNDLDREQKEHMATKTAEQPPHYFRLMKDLTVLGYFSSELGCTQAVRFIESPGRYDGCAPYKKGDRAWFI